MGDLGPTTYPPTPIRQSHNSIVSYNYGLLLTRVGESKARLVQEQNAMILVRAGTRTAHIVKHPEESS